MYKRQNIASPTFTGTVSGITKSMVGLTNVDNISDSNKPISTATQSALNLKQNNLTISPMKGESILATNTTSQLKTISPNPDDNNINVSTSSSADGSQRINIELNTSLSNLTNYYTKPDSDAFLNLKSPINNPILTGTISGITKSMVGLGNVDNTSDLNKPISSAMQAALNDKVPMINPTFTGTTFTTTGLLSCGNISTGSTSLSIINPSNDQVVVFTNTGANTHGRIEFWGDVTCLGDLTVNGLLFGDAFDFKLQPYALAADYSTTSSIASTYQKILSVIKTSSSPLTLDSLTNALTPVSYTHLTLPTNREV